MAKIKHIDSREILDSRGNPTIETEITLTDGIVERSSVPSGSSKGTYEAFELRDGQDRYNGMGVLRAVANVNKIIAPKLQGMDVLDQQKIDRAMIEIDGTQNKSKLGANGILSVSQSVAKAGAKTSLLPLPLYLRQFVSGSLGKKIPIPMFNLIEGGKHAANTLDFQEFLVVPASSKSYSQSLELGVSVYQSLKKVLFERSENTSVADDGGFAPNLDINQNGLAITKEAIERSGFSFSLDAFIGLDVAANSFRAGKVYKIKDRAIPYDQDDLVELYRTLLSDYSLLYIEDPFAEDDWEGWKKIYSAIGDKTLIVGDDLVTTNPYRLQLALDNKVVGGVIIKPNQIGTITEAIAVSEIARYTGLKIIVSHRSGETMDTFIADFAVGIGADYVKFGAPARERVSKYNRLSEIETDFQNL